MRWASSSVQVLCTLPRCHISPVLFLPWQVQMHAVKRVYWHFPHGPVLFLGPVSVRHLGSFFLFFLCSIVIGSQISRKSQNSSARVQPKPSVINLISRIGGNTCVGVRVFYIKTFNNVHVQSFHLVLSEAHLTTELHKDGVRCRALVMMALLHCT